MKYEVEWSTNDNYKINESESRYFNNLENARRFANKQGKLENVVVVTINYWEEESIVDSEEIK